MLMEQWNILSEEDSFGKNEQKAPGYGYYLYAFKFFSIAHTNRPLTIDAPELVSLP